MGEKMVFYSVLRLVGFVAVLIAGLCVDWGWMACGFAWTVVGMLLIAWSAMEENHVR